MAAYFIESQTSAKEDYSSKSSKRGKKANNWRPLRHLPLQAMSLNSKFRGR